MPGRKIKIFSEFGAKSGKAFDTLILSSCFTPCGAAVTVGTGPLPLVKSGTDARGRYTRDEKGGNPMNFKHLLDIRLNLFDGGGAAGGAGAGAAASGDGAPGTQVQDKVCEVIIRR